jgi:hypothetical protein
MNMEPVDWKLNESCNLPREAITVIKHPTHHTISLYNREISEKDFIGIGRQIISIILGKCISNEWGEILSRVANLKKVIELTIAHCRLHDEHL